MEKKIKEYGKWLLQILNACNKSYEQMLTGLNVFCKRLTDNSLPKEKMDEYNKKYSIKELAESKTIRLKKVKTNEAFNFKRNFFIIPEIYLYDKAPDGVLFGLSIYDPTYNKNLPIRIDLFIKREEAIL